MSSVFQGKGGISTRTTGQKEGLFEMEEGSGQHRMRSDTQITTDCDQLCCWAKKVQGLVGLGEGWLVMK